MLVVYFLPEIHYLYMDHVAHFFISFIIGGFLRHYEQCFEALIDRTHMFWVLPLLFGLVLYVIPKACLMEVHEMSHV